MLDIPGHLPTREKAFAFSIVAVLALLAFLILRAIIFEVCEFIRLTPIFSIL